MYISWYMMIILYALSVERCRFILTNYIFFTLPARGIGSHKSKNQIVYPQGVDLSDDRFLCCTSKFCGQFRDPPPVPSSAALTSGLPRAAATLAVLTSVTCLQAIDRGFGSHKGERGIQDSNRIPMVTPHPKLLIPVMVTHAHQQSCPGHHHHHHDRGLVVIVVVV